MNKEIEKIRDRVRDAQKNYKSDLEAVENILLHNRGYITRVPMDEDVVVLCSGGLDSAVMLDLIINEHNSKLHPLFIRRGAAAEKLEEKSFDFFMDFYKERYPENMGEIAKLDYQIPPKQFKDNFQKELALTTGHPLRNSTMQNLAVMCAVALNGKHGLNIKTVLTGSVGEDNTEPELGLLSLRTQTLMTCVQLADWEWQIISPLTDSDIRERSIFKIDLIEYAIEKGIPLDKTRTCFGADEIADGTCNACRKRLDAFEYVRVKDPVKYKTGGRDNGN